MKQTGLAEPALIGQARDLLAQRRVYDAEQLLLGALARDQGNADLLELLADFYEQIERPEAAARALMRCVEVDPGRSQTYFVLAEVLERLERVHEVVDVYVRLCGVRPDLAVCAFQSRGVPAPYRLPRRSRRRVSRRDRSRYRRRRGCMEQSRRRAGRTRAPCRGARSVHPGARVDPRGFPRCYNLGLLHEEFGEREAALEQFERVLAIDPEHHDAFARIVHANSGAVTTMPSSRGFGRDCKGRLTGRTEVLSFALGSVLDACGRYEDAFAAYAAGNAIARRRAQPYDRAANEREHATLAALFGASWLAAAQPVSTAPLVFVCGMWRSGTTLLERMLGESSVLDVRRRDRLPQSQVW